MFDTKVAIIVLDDLAVWQKLNVTAFLATGIAGAAPEAMGEPYEDAAGRLHARLLGQPILVFAAGAEGLARAWRVAIERELTRAVYVRAMFETGHDAANRAVFKAESVGGTGFGGGGGEGGEERRGPGDEGAEAARVENPRPLGQLLPQQHTQDSETRSDADTDQPEQHVTPSAKLDQIGAQPRELATQSAPAVS